ncbi:hypothetical protein J4Q44_G00022930 [Coregonus suidteri]|uniref:trypsin n=1 Tax=Coregonus suidteri TaxID=861788 RepID=A0AAN8MH34_9TELE
MRLLALILLVGAAAAVPREDGKIIGGQECEPHSRPWMASLNYGYHFCGAVLINEQWVLSVAHCWYNYDYQTLDYDMMLIKLFHPVEITDYVKPIPLPTSCPNAGLPCSVSGWGNTATGEEVNMPARLQCLDVPILEDEKCEKAYPGMLTRRMVCAGYMDGGRDACNGDSGSGLVCLGEVHGLVSWGQGCAVPGYPGVYVKVCEFLPWIDETMKANM